MKKYISIFLSAVMLLGIISSSGALTAVAVDENTVEETTVEDSTAPDDMNNDSDTDDNAVGDTNAVYSVIGNSEQLFYYADNIYDKTTEMTYDSRVGLYKFMFYEVDPENDIRIKIVKNHSVNQDFDVQSTFFIFDVVSTCDVLVTFDDKTGTTNVLGEGVAPFNVRNVVLLGSGNKAFSWDYTSESDRMTEVEQGVWEIEYNDVMTTSDPYCQAFFAINPVGLPQKYSMSYGFGNTENEIVESGVETDAGILNSHNIAFKIEKNYSKVKFRLDLRNFDCLTKKGAKFTVTVTPPEEEPVFSIVFQKTLDMGHPRPEILMQYDPKTGLYECSFTCDVPASDNKIYVWKNHGEDGVYPEDGKPYYYDVIKGCNFKITFDHLTGQIDVTGDGIITEEQFKIKSVTAAGNGSGSYLNGKYFAPTDKSNNLTQTSEGIWEIKYDNVSASGLYQLKFALNVDDYPGEPWMLSFGSENSAFCQTGVEQPAVYSGKEIFFKVDRDYSTVSIKLDLRDFDFRTKQGAKFTVKVEPPDYVIRFKDADKDILMTLNEETGLFEYETFYYEKSYGQEFYIYGNGKVYGDPYSDKMYYYDVLRAETVTITMDPATERINVTGAIGNIQTSDSFKVKTVIAAGNGDGAWLNGVSWNTRKTVNTLTETSDGIWEIEYKNVKANDSYKVKFAVNPFDYSELWKYCFGFEQTGTFVNGEEVTAAYGGTNCLVEVEEDDSTVHLRLDLRDFDYRTKQGAKLTITVTPPEIVPEWTAEPITVEPTVAEDVYGVQTVDTGSYMPMTYNEDSELYELIINDAQPQTMSINVVKNHSEICNDEPYTFSIIEPCDVMITFDPLTNELNVTGDGVDCDTEAYVYSVIAAGNGRGNYLNGADWDPWDTSNSLTEVSDGVWEIKMEDIDAFDYYYFKFVANTVDEYGNRTVYGWDHNFGTAGELVEFMGTWDRYMTECPTNQEIDAVYGVGNFNCWFKVPYDRSVVTLRLDLRNFDFKTKRGAKLKITVEPPIVVEPTLGDVNNDDVVDILDAVLVQKYSAEKTELTGDQLLVADFNGDGNVDILDASAIQKAAAER